MKTIHPIIFLLGLLSIPTIAMAKPEACPKVSALKTVGVKYAKISFLGWQVASDPDYFGTKDLWRLTIMLPDDKSKSEIEVIAHANVAIGSLIFSGGPEATVAGWVCIYANLNGNVRSYGMTATK